MRLSSTAAALLVVLLSGEGIDAQKLRTVGAKDLAAVDVTAQGTSSVQMVPAAGKAEADGGEKRQYRGKGKQRRMHEGKGGGIRAEQCDPLDQIQGIKFDSLTPSFPFFFVQNAQVSTWAGGW